MGGLAADTELSGCRVDELVLLPPRASTESLGYVWTPGTSSTSSMGGLAADTVRSGCRLDELVLVPPGASRGSVSLLPGLPRDTWCGSSRPIEAPS